MIKQLVWDTKTVNGQGVLSKKLIETEPEPMSEAEKVELRSEAKMSRQEFALVSAQKGWITETEAEDWAAGAAIPAFVLGVINSGAVPAEQILAVRIAVRTQLEIGRLDRLVPLMMSAMGVDDAEMDAVYGLDLE